MKLCPAVTYRCAAKNFSVIITTYPLPPTLSLAYQGDDYKTLTGNF